MAKHSDNDLYWVLGRPIEETLKSPRRRADQEALLTVDFGWANLSISFLQLVVIILLNCCENWIK